MEREDQTIRALEEYGDMVRRICFMHLKNYSDAEDVFQEVFLSYMLRGGKPFESHAHEKAWLIRVSINACKDSLKSFFRRKTVPLEELSGTLSYTQETHDILDAVLHLPSKYRDVIYLFYYEGYTAIEIGEILHKNVNTIYTWLSRGKAELKKQLGGSLIGT